MADVLDSTPTPSRRRFFGSAIAAGVLVAQSPLFIEPDPQDSVVMRLASLATALRAKEQACGNAICEIETQCHEMAGPVPEKPVCHRKAFATWAEYDGAVDVWQAELKARDARLTAAGEALGFGAAEAAWNAAIAAFWPVVKELTTTRATTLEGVIAKARIADAERDDDLTASLVADLLAMRGSP